MSAADLIAPHALPGGSRVWLAPETRDFIQRLEELDPRLALVKNADGTWAILRVPEDGTGPVCVMRSKTPNAKLCPDVIEMLRARDTRRGHDPVEEIIRHNNKVQKDAEDKAVEQRFLALDKMLSKSWRGRVASNVEDLSL